MQSVHLTTKKDGVPVDMNIVLALMTFVMDIMYVGYLRMGLVRAFISTKAVMFLPLVAA